MKVLVIGGTGFIGRRLVKELVEHGDEVFTATSGFSANPFSDSVTSIRVDRFMESSAEEMASTTGAVDVIYDTIAFGPSDVEPVLEAYRNLAEHYVFISSAAVYESSISRPVEKDFTPGRVDAGSGGLAELGYAEGKRGAENFIAAHSHIPFTIIRPPVVLGHDDVAGREQFVLNRIDGRLLRLVKRVHNGEEVVIPDAGARRNYAWVEDVGRFLHWAGKNRMRGVYNTASRRGVNSLEVIDAIAELTGAEPNVLVDATAEDSTDFYYDTERIVDPSRAERAGFSFMRFDEWFPKAVQNCLAGLTGD